MRPDWEENERVRWAVLAALEGGDLTYQGVMAEVGYEGKSSVTIEGRRVDRALQFHRRHKRVRYWRHLGRWSRTYYSDARDRTDTAS